MFFSKDKKNEKDKKAPNWSISAKGIKNNITGVLYDTEGLTYASISEGEKIHATIWYQHKYLCNLTIMASQSDIFRNNYIGECDAFIENFTDVSFTDSHNNQVEISIPHLRVNSKEYGLSGLRTLKAQSGFTVHYYGNYLTTIDESHANLIEKAKDIYLQRKHGVLGSKTRKQFEESQHKKIKHANKDEILVTTEAALNLNITKRLDVITAECVYGMNIFKDIFASFTDVLGGRSNSIQDTLRDARKTALDELRNEAASIGANAVIGVDLDYSEISGGGKSGMLFIVASGTAVIIE